MNFWDILGYSGQLLFSMRFFMQWVISEKRQQSTIPTSFWYFSIVGSLLLLTYSIYIKNGVFILGQSLGSLIYLRNLILIYRKGRIVV